MLNEQDLSRYSRQIIIPGFEEDGQEELLSKKILIVGAISKMDGHIFTFDFKNENNPCLKCFYQTEPSDEILNLSLIHI